MDFTKYKRGYFMPPTPCLEWSKKEFIEHAPKWCSVDLRDGNQALITPMSLDEKIEFFKLLVELGFKEIEVGFPAASATEYDFLRALIEQNLIPKGVAIQVLTQAREHIIRKTFDALKGCEDAIVHFYNSTSFAQRQQVFRKTKDEIKAIAVDGAKLCKKIADEVEGNFRFEYSPESFTGTELEYALEVCNAVIDTLCPTPQKPLIINLPATVEMSLPHIYASAVEFMSKNLKMRESVILSLHPHNDRGCAVASAELGLLAGGDRVEGTLFGNGERTGNVDIITLAMNLYTHGIDPKLDFSDIPRVCALYERVSKMRVHERQPYSGKLVFAAFSGSHQDAIAKGMNFREQEGLNLWSVPYLPLDPKDVGREYESDVIRINSQSGKGGIAFVLHTQHGIDLPVAFREHFSYFIKDISDKKHKELGANEIVSIFHAEFVNLKSPLNAVEFHFAKEEDIIKVDLRVEFSENLALNLSTNSALNLKASNSSENLSLKSDAKNFGENLALIKGTGNGRLDAVANALRENFGLNFDIVDYNEHSLQQGSNSQAISYVQIKSKERRFFGVGIDTDIINASVFGLISAINRMIKA